jgi:hypothetical protein
MKTKASLHLGIFLFVFMGSVKGQYDKNYVSQSSEVIEGELYTVVEMTRLDERVKVKYFADATNGVSVYNRYLNWSKNKSIIATTSGTYFSNEKVPRPVGICLDDGIAINKTLITGKMDGFVIVYSTGGIVASSLKEGNLTVNIANKPVTLNLNNPVDRVKFFNWGSQNGVTAFQTHLLYFKNKIQIFENSSENKRERRFMLATMNDKNVVNYYLVNLKGSNTLYAATQKVVKYIQNFTDNIVYMVNLDTGAQDYYEVRDSDGKKINDESYSGVKDIKVSKNLLVFYFE